MQELDIIIQQEIIINRPLIKQLISFIDLTTLNENDTEQNVLAVVEKANKGFNEVHPAAVCTFPCYGAIVRKNLKPSIKAAVVGGCFPTGKTLTTAKVEEIRTITETGVDEIDVVMNRGDFFLSRDKAIFDEIFRIKVVAGAKHIKVILETGELKSTEYINRASELVMNAGADFIKTSTGKTTVGATPEAVYTMCKAIKVYYENTEKKVGIKPSGGIRTLDDALIYYKIVKFVLGDEWLTPELFRIGTSSLYDNLIGIYDKIE